MYTYIECNLSIHLCYVDLKNRLVYCLYKNNSLSKLNICKVICNKKNIKDIKLYIFKDTLNIFLVEYISHNLNNLVHIHYNLNHHDYNSYTFDNLCFSDFSYYNYLNNYLIVCLRYSCNCVQFEDKFCFDLTSKTWSKFNNSKLNQSLLKYCDKLIYK